jgi:hypothetical protein
MDVRLGLRDLIYNQTDDNLSGGGLNPLQRGVTTMSFSPDGSRRRRYECSAKSRWYACFRSYRFSRRFAGKIQENASLDLLRLQALWLTS